MDLKGDMNARAYAHVYVCVFIALSYACVCVNCHCTRRLHTYVHKYILPRESLVNS